MSISTLLLCPGEFERRILCQTLEAYRAAVDICASAEETYQRLLLRSYDAMIVDCDAPDAAWLFQAMRLHEPSRHMLKVAIVSPEMSASQSFALGATFCFSKPVTIERAERSLRALQLLASRERRRTPRFNVHLEATCVFNLQRAVTATVLDLSETGMLVRFQCAPEEKTGLMRVERPSSGDNLIDCAGQIRWIDDSHRAGIRFLGMDPAERARLRNWLEQQGTTLAPRNVSLVQVPTLVHAS